MIISKEIVEEAVKISEAIVNENLANKSISQGIDSKVNNEKYNNIIKPTINDFVARFGYTPNKILNNYLKEFIKEKNLSSNFESKGFHYSGHKLNSHCWACITKIDPNIKDRKASHYPQLYILINRHGIKFGFCYGDQVDDANDMVKFVRENKEVQNEIIKTIEKHRDFEFFQALNPIKIIDTQRMPELKNYDEIITEWHNESHIIKHINTNEIPVKIEQDINDSLVALLKIFTTISLLSTEQISEESETKIEKKIWEKIENSLKVNNLGENPNIEDLYFENEAILLDRIKTALQENHIILIGPPGTGKSKLAKIICEFYRGKDGYVMSTATSDWSTFETIGGYRPDPDTDNNLKFYPGIFLKCFKDDNKDKEPINKWLIIDEINRADIDKAFGSLFSALTGDDITLPFEILGEPLKIIGKPDSQTQIKDNLFIKPPDWRIIATMNTFDKASLYEMSYAFMRRFAFIPIDVPNKITENLIDKYREIWKLRQDNEVSRRLKEIWEEVNKRRKVGPAIIEDMYRYITGSASHDYTSAIILYLLPQFEGLSEEKQTGFIKKIASPDLLNNPDELIYFASDFFEIEERKFRD